MFKVAGPLWAQATAGGDNFFGRLVKTGKKVLRRVLQNRELEHTSKDIPKPTWSLQAQPVQVGQSSSRRLIGGLFPQQVLKTQAAEIRRQAALRLIRDSRKVPVFAFVGLSLGFSASGQETGTDYDALCSGIRGLFEQHGTKETVVMEEAGQQFSLETLQLGQLIGKGCNAAVYEARHVNSFSDMDDTKTDSGSSVDIPVLASLREARCNYMEDTASASLSSDFQRDSDGDQAETANSPDADSGSDVHVADDGAPPALFHTDDYVQTECDEEDEDFTIISEDETDFDDDPSSSSSDVPNEVNMDGWVLYRVHAMGSPVPASATISSDDGSDSDSDIFILAGDADGLESVPDLEDFMEQGQSMFNIRPPDTSSCSNTMPESTGSSCSSCSLSSGVSSDTILQSDSGNNSETLPDPEPAPNIHGSGDYGLAVKMMFNYSVVSQADEIMTAMAKETVPAQFCVEQDAVGASPRSLQDGLRKLPPHPNIVDMHGVFVDQTPELPEGPEVYPSALPPRLNKDGGFGRNATMFLVMKKYDMTLREYLSMHDPDIGTRCLLFAQLLEGVAHLSSQEIAHRDLKSDNILLDLSHGVDRPSLAISDFGCCLADPTYGLKLPYLVREVNKGGNGALMAPEIKCAKPGKDSVLDYSKADLWAAGALAYEMFGGGNPFYHQMDARTYSQDDLPSFPADVPETVVRLVDIMLRRDPAERPSPAAAATAMQLYLWAPTHLQPFLTEQLETHSSPLWRCKELCYLLQQFTMETVCQRVYGGGASPLVLEMKTTFLSRIRWEDIFATVALD